MPILRGQGMERKQKKDQELEKAKAEDGPRLRRQRFRRVFGVSKPGSCRGYMGNQPKPPNGYGSNIG